MSEQYVIGEGVVLDARPASFMSRALAMFLDALVYGVPLVFSIAWMATSGRLDASYGAQFVICMVVLFLIVVPLTIETLTRGRTLGKLAAGIRVVRDDGGPVALRHSFIRAIVAILEIWITFGAVAVGAALTNNKGKRLGDMLAGTYVIRVRSKKTVDPVLVVPDYLLSWVKNTDIGKLPDGLALASRQFLARRWNMSPHTRQAMARQFRQELSTRVAPQPPFEVHDEDYILAVVTERSERESVMELNRLRHAEGIQAQMESTPFGIQR